MFVCVCVYVYARARAYTYTCVCVLECVGRCTNEVQRVYDVGCQDYESLFMCDVEVVLATRTRFVVLHDVTLPRLYCT